MPDPLSSMPHRPHSPCTVAGAFTLATGRVHEFCGPARHAMALAAAMATRGPVIWITPAWQPGRLNGEAVTRWIDPARLLVARARRAVDLLWCMEEALRAGAVPLVVAELPEPPPLTPVRRLHLAAQAGGAAARAPLGLVLTPGAGGAPGVESRWHAAPDHTASLTRWRLSRTRARMAPPASWHLSQPAPRAPLSLTALPALDETG